MLTTIRAIHEDIRKILAGASKANDNLAQAKSALFGEQAPSSDHLEFEIESAFQGQEGLPEGA